MLDQSVDAARPIARWDREEPMRNGSRAAKGWCLVLWVHHFGFLFAPRTRMDRLLNKKSKKSLKSSRGHIALGIPTNVATGPLGFRADLDIGPKGE